MKLTKTLGIVIALTMLLAFVSHLPHTHAAYGTRTEDVIMKFYSCQGTAWAGLVGGEMDILAWPLDNIDYYEEAIIRPEIVLSQRFENDDVFGYAFNLNTTIYDYPNVVSPMKSGDFRKAIAYLVDKDYIVNGLVGMARRIDVPVPYSQKDWWAESVTGINYPYEINKDMAASVLDEANFIQGTNPNPYWESQYSYSAQYNRTYPDYEPWVGEEGRDLDPIVFCIPSDDPIKEAVGDYLVANMRSLGIPVKAIKKSETGFQTRVNDEENYHIFAGGQLEWKAPIDLWMAGVKGFAKRSGNVLLRAPNGAELSSLGSEKAQMHAYFLEIQNLVKNLNSWRDAFVGWQKGMVSTFLSAAEESWKSVTYNSSMVHNKLAQEAYVDAILGIPVWSTSAFYAWRNDTLGVVMKDGQGVLNEYTYMNAYRVGGGALRIGLPHAPTQLNIMHSHWNTDYYVLQALYPELMSYAPADRDIDQPWIVRDWSVGTWNNPETEEQASFIDFWFRDNLWVAETETGAQGDHFDAYDFEFTLHYIYAQAWKDYWHIPHWDRIKDLYNVTVIDEYHARVYLGVKSFWAVNWPTFPVLPKDIWLRDNIPLTVKNTTNPFFGVTETGISLPGYLPIREPIVSGSCATGSPEPENDTWVQARANNEWVTLEWGTDYEWRHGKLYVKVDSIGSHNIIAIQVPKFWTYGDTGGYLPGGMDWESILAGYGPYYVVDLTPGFISLKRNAFFFLETPPLGEIDWAWKPAGGYKIDVFDVVIAASAYGSYGTGVPDSNWFPAADLAPDGGKIDIFDITAVTSHYGSEFGKP